MKEKGLSTEKADGSVDEAQLSILAFLHEILSRSWTHRMTFIIFIGLASTSVVFYLAFPLLFQGALDHGVEKRDIEKLFFYLMLVGVCFLANTISTYGQLLSLSKLTGELTKQLRLQLFTKLHHCSGAYLEEHETSELLTHFTTDLAAVEKWLAYSSRPFVVKSLVLILSLVLIFWIQWRLALLVLVLAPLSSLGGLMGARATQAGHKRKQSDAAVAGFVDESIRLQNVTRFFGLFNLRRRLFVKSLSELRKHSIDEHRLSGTVGRINIFFTDLMQFSIFGFGVYLMLEGSITVGGLFAFIGMMINIAGSITSINDQMPILYDAKAGLQRILRFLQQEDTFSKQKGGVEVQALTHELVFEQVSFAYRSDRRVLNDLSFRIKKGERVAFVGLSGAGKSTLFHLLMRKGRPQQGRILFDDVPLEEIGLSSFYRRFSIVSQKTQLFHTSVRENIRVGRPQASDQEVEEAAHLAEIHEDIMGFPQGYQTPVGELGGALSGGQAQRLSIARSLLHRPDVLLLDEATSALDAETESNFLATLLKLDYNWTILTITHRLRPLVDFDRIIVLEDGALFESGTHQELLANEGVYARLWHHQMGFEEVDGVLRVTAERLGELPLFQMLNGMQTLDEDWLEALADGFVMETFKQDEIVFHQGTPGARLYLIVQGEAVVYLRDQAGLMRQINLLREGDYFGEIALLQASRRTATVKAAQDLTCLSLTRHQFLQLLSRKPKLYQNINEIIAMRLGV